MGCTSPNKGYYSREVNPATGKRLITFNRNAALSGIGMDMPCGQCHFCRLKHAREWAMRCMHEKRMHNLSEFVTLTYDDDHLPKFNTLVRRDPQLFLKRVRKKYGQGIRFYGCGEYGERTLRPHYHLLFFGFEFPDKQLYKVTRNGDRLYTSAACSDLWEMGYTVHGEVTFDSAAYVSQYVTKKRTGKEAYSHYWTLDPDTGECFDRLPEFPMRSLGIGRSFFEKYKGELYAHDNAIFKGHETPLPRYYDNRFEVTDKDRLLLLKRKRKRMALRGRADNSPDRRRVKETVAIAKSKLFKREL